MQTIYTADPPIGIHGQKIEGYPSAIATGLATNEVISVGALVIFDAGGTGALEGKSVRAPALTTEVTVLPGVAGLAMWDPTYPEPPYRLGSSLPVMRKGRMAIVAETALVAHTNPFVRFGAVGAGQYLGALRGDSDAGNAVAAPYITVIVGAALGGVAIVEIDL